MAWHINITETAKKQLKKMDRQTAQRITSYLRERVLSHENPRMVGAALQGDRLGTCGNIVWVIIGLLRVLKTKS